MRRKSPAERVAKYRVRRDKPEVAAGRRRSSPTLSARTRDEIGEAEPDMPEGLRGPGRGHVGGADRHRRPRWRRLARPGSQGGGRAVGDGSAPDTTLGERLLADLRDVFGDADAMHGETILDGLHKIGEAPWADYSAGR